VALEDMIFAFAFLPSSFHTMGAWGHPPVAFHGCNYVMKGIRFLCRDGRIPQDPDIHG
jgi:hypothetical protein